MTRSENTPAPSPGQGLRIRLWIGCLSGALLATGAIAFLLARAPQGAGPFEAEARWVWLPAILGGAVLISIALALWLDRRIVAHLNGLARSLADTQVAELRGLPSTSGWGELSELTLRVEALLARQRQLARAGGELVRMRERVARVQEALDRWSKIGTWEPLSAGSPTEATTTSFAPLVAILNRELPRVSVAAAVGRESTSALERETSAALDEVREVAEQSERGFVEATALLTTVRELDRLSVELEGVLAAPVRSADQRARTARESLQRYRAASAQAIETLVSASTESVVNLANGMQRMSEIADQTHLISNRATLIALHAITGKASAEPGGTLAEELKALARDVRVASDRVSELTLGIQNDAQRASEHMIAVREDIAAALESAPAPDSFGADEVPADTQRLMERVREMVRDAAAKGERLSSAGERVSRAAEQLRRRVEGETELVAQLAAAFRGKAAAEGGATPANAHLRMLELAEEEDEPPAGTGRAEAGEDPASDHGSTA